MRVVTCYGEEVERTYSLHGQWVKVMLVVAFNRRSRMNVLVSEWSGVEAAVCAAHSAGGGDGERP